MNFLIVDDYAMARLLVVNVLEEIGHNQYQEAVNGSEALEKSKDALKNGEPFDIVLLDWNLPKMDGIEFLEEFRSMSEYNDSAVIMVTAEAEIANMAKAIETGATSYLSKPYNKDELIAKIQLVEEWLQKKRTEKN